MATTLAGCAVLVALGCWQVKRLQWKTQLIAQETQALAAPPQELPLAYDAATGAMTSHRVTMSGYFLNEHALTVRPRTRDDKVGGDLVVPFQRVSGDVVYVDRGFVPDGFTGVIAPQGLSRVQGILQQPQKGRFTPDNAPQKNQWYWIDPFVMAQAAGIKGPAPYIVIAERTDETTYPSGRALSVDLPNNHLQYAIFWFTMAAILLGMSLLYQWRGDEEGPNDKDDHAKL